MVIFHGYVRRWPGDVGHPSGSAGRACRSQKCGTIGKAKFRFQMIQMVPREMLLSMTFYLGNDHFDLNNWITIGHRIIVSNKKWALPPAGGLEAPKLSKTFLLWQWSLKLGFTTRAVTSLSTHPLDWLFPSLSKQTIKKKWSIPPQSSALSFSQWLQRTARVNDTTVAALPPVRAHMSPTINEVLGWLKHLTRCGAQLPKIHENSILKNFDRHSRETPNARWDDRKYQAATNHATEPFLGPLGIKGGNGKSSIYGGL